MRWMEKWSLLNGEPQSPLILPERTPIHEAARVDPFYCIKIKRAERSALPAARHFFLRVHRHELTINNALSRDPIEANLFTNRCRDGVAHGVYHGSG